MTAISINAHDSNDIFIDDPENPIEDENTSELSDLISESFFHEQPTSARRVVASHAENSQECRNFMLMLGIFPGQTLE